MKKEQVLNAIVGKLISEGVLAENYNTNEALMVLSHCVMPIKLQAYLVNCEEEVKVRLEKLSQIKQINATENPESLPRIKQQFTADEQLILFPIRGVLRGRRHRFLQKMPVIIN